MFDDVPAVDLWVVPAKALLNDMGIVIMSVGLCDVDHVFPTCCVIVSLSLRQVLAARVFPLFLVREPLTLDMRVLDWTAFVAQPGRCCACSQ